MFLILLSFEIYFTHQATPNCFRVWLRLTTGFVFFGVFIQGTKPGGAEEDRTPDPLLAKQALSQLSYSPSLKKFETRISNIRNKF